MKHKKTFEAIAKLKDVEAELHRLKNALEMANRGLDAKREWRGLTDVDVSKILDEQNGFYTFEKCFNFAKAIEAKLKERNHDQ